MKILVAIQSDNNAYEMAHTTLRWAARAGFNLRVFIPDESQLAEYENAIDDCNYSYYFNIPNSVIVVNEEPIVFAKRNGFDLLIILPDNLLDWRTINDDDKTFIEYAEDIAKARVQFGKVKGLASIKFDNGASIMRL